MARTVTHGDLLAALDGVIGAARAARLDPSRWALQTGSTTYGRPYRLVSVDLETGAQSSALGTGDHLGWTRREAHCALAAMRAALLAVADLQRVA